MIASIGPALDARPRFAYLRPRMSDFAPAAARPVPRVLAIGLDAADRDLILGWAAEGALPTWRGLLERGLSGSTEPPPGLYVGAIWPTFSTGVSPARHGRYCFRQLEAGTYRIRHVRSDDLRAEPFWVALGRAGRRVAVIDVPKSPLAPELPGVQLCDWGTHDPDQFGVTRSCPADFARRVIERYGRDPVGNCDASGKTAPAIAAFRDALLARIERKTRLALELLDREPWDLFLLVYGDSHCAGHQLWAVHDPANARHDPAVAAALGSDPLRDVYVALDAAVGRLLARAGPETTTIVLASHGMGPHYNATFLLDDILATLDRTAPSRARAAAIRALEATWRRVPRRLRRPVRRAFDRLWRPHAARTGREEMPLAQAWLTPDVARRRFFAIPNNDVYGAIRVNLAGREPEGRVQPGPEVDALFADLRRDLLEVVNPRTGRPVVRDVVRTRDLFPEIEREGAADFPDFLVEWDRSAPVTEVRSPKIGTIRRAFGGVRTGDHRSPGLFVAAGPGVQPARLERPVAMADFAPTFGALLGVPLPGLDGRPIEAVRGAAVAGAAP